MRISSTPGGDSSGLGCADPRRPLLLGAAPPSAPLAPPPASIYDKYSVGPSSRPICTKCCFTMTNIIQVCSNFHRTRVSIINTLPDEIATRTSLEHISQSRPDSGLNLSHFRYEDILKHFKLLPLCSRAGSGRPVRTARLDSGCRANSARLSLSLPPHPLFLSLSPSLSLSLPPSLSLSLSPSVSLSP